MALVQMFSISKVAGYLGLNSAVAMFRNSITSWELRSLVESNFLHSAKLAPRGLAIVVRLEFVNGSRMECMSWRFYIV